MKWATRSLLIVFILGAGYSNQRRQFLFSAQLQDPVAPQQAPAPVATEPRKDPWWVDRHNSMNKQVAKGGVGIVFIGDSITQGWEGEGKDAWAANFAQFNSVNLGIGGDQTKQVLWRLQNGNLQGITPKAAVLMIGTNNTAGGVQPEVTAAGVRAILDEIRSRCPDTKILLLAVFPRGETADDQLRLANDQVNALLKPMSDGEHIFFMDIGPKFLLPGGKLDRGVMPDMLHLSSAAYATWAEAIMPTLKQWMAESPAPASPPSR